MNPSQNQPVNCASINATVLCARVRSRFIKNTTTAPLNVLSNPRSFGLALRIRTNTNTSTAPINIGTSQSNASSCLARFRPLSVSFAPPQLTCTHGRKKQTNTMIAALRLMRLNIFGPWALVKARTVLLGEIHEQEVIYVAIAFLAYTFVTECTKAAYKGRVQNRLR